MILPVYRRQCSLFRRELWSKYLREKHKEIEWKDVAGMRDKIIHFYFGVKWEIVWDVIKNEIPLLKEKIEKILNGIEN